MSEVLNTDIVVAGGGATGLAFAAAVKSVAGKALTVTICDPDLAHEQRHDSRAYAMVAGAVRLFQSIGAWEGMAAHAEPIRSMEITDSGLEEIIRPLLLSFGEREETELPFAQMLPNAVILEAMLDCAKDLDVRLLAEPIASVEQDGTRVVARTGDRKIRARLLVAADGRNSRLRQAADIPSYGWSYGQTAIVGTMSHSLPHEGVAVQHFLPAGPFAMLPLKGGYKSSIVWSETEARAKALLAGYPDDLVSELEARAAGRFGTVSAFDNVQAFPLAIGIARAFVSTRMALLGDAAHGIHPIAGQGLNYGLRGAAALAETVLDAARLGLDIGSAAALQPYEKSRRPDVMAMALATEALNRLFSTDLAAVRAVRDLGLGATDRLPAIKRLIMQQAEGKGSLAPRAFRGEPL